MRVCQLVDSFQKKSNTYIVSPYSGSSEESAALKYTYKSEKNDEIEAVHLITLFEMDGAEVPAPWSSLVKLSEVPKELVPIIMIVVSC